MQRTNSRMKADTVEPQKYRCSVFRFVPIVMTPFMLVACGAFRIHDKGRSEIAQQAVESSVELNSDGSAVFGPMEQNLDSVRETEEKLVEIAYKQAYESRKRIIATMTAKEIATNLEETMDERFETIGEIEESQSEVVNSVNKELDRQASLTKILYETSSENLGDTLKRVQKRLDWVEKIVTNASRLSESLKKDSKDSLSDSLLTEGDIDSEKIKKVLEKAKKSIEEVENDERVDAATKLLQQVGITTASIEQTRLLEMKRHLGEIQRIKELIDNHDKVSVQELLVPALGHLMPDAIGTLTAKLKERYKSLENINFKPKKDKANYLVACWKDGTLASYVATDLKVAKVIQDSRNVEELGDEALKKAASGKAQYIGKSPKLIASFGILTCYEREYFRNVQLLLAREEHRYSIRLSKINAQQRADIVNQLAQGLDIYYKGGIKPEDVAEIALLASQVGSLIFIGTQVH